MAWHDNGNLIVAYRTADCLGGHVLQSPSVRKLLRDLSVGHSCSVWYGTEDLPHFILKFCPCKMKRYLEIRLPSGEVDVEPALRVVKKRDAVFLMLMIQVEREIFLSFKPQSGQSDVVGRQKDVPEGRIIMADILHMDSSFITFFGLYRNSISYFTGMTEHKTQVFVIGTGMCQNIGVKIIS